MRLTEMTNFIKKRIIIALIATIFMAVALNKFWLKFEPVSVELNIKGNDNCNIEAVLNKKNNNKFDKVRNADVNLNLNDKENIELYIKKIKHPKRIKINISDFQNPNTFVISNISFNKGKIKLNDFENFEVQGGTSKIEDNSLVIVPNSNYISVIYKNKLDISAICKTDYELFIIIIFLSFLLFYKLADYAANFNTLRGKSRTDIVFLSLFFISLFIPFSCVDTDDISKMENRTLAKWVPLYENGKINYNFGKDFNNWFNDRFYLRKRMINLHYWTLSLFGNYYETDEIIYNKKADFAYNKTFNAVDRFLKKDPFTETELKKIYSTFEKLNKYCNENNVKLYVILSNDKESIYPEYYPEYYKPENNPSRLEQVKKVLKTIPGLKIISQEENLLKAKEKELVFMPYDTHLNSLGTYIEYKTIIDETKKQYPILNAITKDKTDFIQIDADCDTLPPERFISKKYRHSASVVIKKRNSTVNNEINNKTKSYFYVSYINPNNKLNAVIIGDSFHRRYTDLMAENFHSLKSLFVGHGKNLILDEELKRNLFNEKPDILYIETTERFLYRFLNMDSYFDIFDKKYRR